MTSLGNIVYLVKCLSKPYLKHFFDCKMFIAATSFNPPGTIFKQGSDKWQKITWIKYWIIPKRNYFQVACSILINILPKVSLIPNFTFSNKCNLIDYWTFIILSTAWMFNQIPFLGLSPDDCSKVKHVRRTLKNRGYAANSRKQKDEEEKCLTEDKFYQNVSSFNASIKAIWRYQIPKWSFNNQIIKPPSNKQISALTTLDFFVFKTD